jgi:hypothetical protein
MGGCEDIFKKQTDECKDILKDVKTERNKYIFLIIQNKRLLIN